MSRVGDMVTAVATYTGRPMCGLRMARREHEG